MMLLGIDPGPVESAWVIYDDVTKRPVQWAKEHNELLRHTLPRVQHCAIEMIASYGMAVGQEVFDTCVWIGLFAELHLTAARPLGGFKLVYRLEVKKHLCHDGHAKDPNVRQALIDRYGGKDQAIGLKKTPGPLYGMTGDCWAALGVAITAAETGV
jgi:hypothetical protein